MIYCKPEMQPKCLVTRREGSLLMVFSCGKVNIVIISTVTDIEMSQHISCGRIPRVLS